MILKYHEIFYIRNEFPFQIDFFIVFHQLPFCKTFSEFYKTLNSQNKNHKANFRLRAENKAKENSFFLETNKCMIQLLRVFMLSSKNKNI